MASSSSTMSAVPQKSVGKTSLSLPSPTGSSVSETSDYQRSTPSPKNSEENGSSHPWSTGRSHSNSSSSRDDSSDAGFSEEQQQQQQHPRLPSVDSQKGTVPSLPPPSNGSLTAHLRCIRRRSTFAGGERTSEVVVVDDPRLTLHKVRVELEKIPGKAKRRHSDDDKEEHGSKRRRSEGEMKPPLAAADSRMMLFAALRKEKLDRLDEVLNLKANAKISDIVKEEEEEAAAAAAKKLEDLKSASVDLKLAKNTTDLILLSQLKQINKDAASLMKEEAEIKGESGGESSPSVPATPDEACFSKPTAIRFPVQNKKQFGEGATVSQSHQQNGGQSQQQQDSRVSCKWEGCDADALESESKLLDHIRSRHAATQNPGDADEDFAYKCLWRGCKVFGKGSSSRSWLEKHVASHSGSKPFQCIVDGCKARFGSQSILERHVNSHFKNAGAKIARGASAADGDGDGGSGNGASGSGHHHHPSAPPAAAVRQLRRAGKRMKFRKTIYSARIFDLFDVGIMAQVRERLSLIEENSAQLSDTLSSRDEIRFTSKIIARRKASKEEVEAANTSSPQPTSRATRSKAANCKEESQQPECDVMVLQRWIPENILPDSWCLLRCAQPTKTLSIKSLPHSAKASLAPLVLDPLPPSQQMAASPQRRPRKTKHPLPKGERLS